MSVRSPTKHTCHSSRPFSILTGALWTKPCSKSVGHTMSAGSYSKKNSRTTLPGASRARPNRSCSSKRFPARSDSRIASSSASTSSFVSPNAVKRPFTELGASVSARGEL